MSSKETPEIPTRRKEYTNSFRTFEAIWSVLQKHSSRSHPLSVSRIHELLTRTIASYNQLPSCSTISKMLRSEIFLDTLTFPFRLRCMAQVNGALVPYECWEEQAERQHLHNNRPRLYYLESPLSSGEWRLISDLIQGYPFLTQEETARFLEVLQYLYPQQQLFPNRYPCKYGSPWRFSVSNQLDQAIRERRAVDLQYAQWQLERQQDRWQPVLRPKGSDGALFCHLEPYAFIWSNGNYYLVASGERGMVNLRADRICRVRLLEDRFHLPPDFDPAEYRDSTPLMCSGKRAVVRLRCRTSMLSVLVDFFGAKPEFSTPRDGMVELTMRIVPDGVKLFALQYCDSVEVLQPLSLRESIAAALKDAGGTYGLQTAL